MSAAIRDITSRKEAAAALAHAALPGDQVVVKVAERVRATVRAGDTVARFGGDEFVVLCEGADTAGRVADLAERVNTTLCAPFVVQGAEFFLSASIGIALGLGSAATADGLLRDADAAMYRAKERGRAGVELTETVLMEDLEFHGRTLTALRDLGVSLAIDDFGTGYSSLTYLRRFPVSTVKIDRSFVAGLGANLADSAIVDSVINLAHALGLEVVAEGTETAEQVACLLDLGCDKAQGFIFAVPGPAEEIDALLDAGVRGPVVSSTSRSWP